MLATVMWLLSASSAAFQAPARGVLVAGGVQDQTGAVLPRAQVLLVAAGAASPAQSVVSDPAGLFRSEQFSMRPRY
jgi:hypothetical protein